VLLILGNHYCCLIAGFATKKNYPALHILFRLCWDMLCSVVVLLHYSSGV